MKIFDVFPEGFDVLVNGVRGDAADLDEAVVLDEDGVTGQVTVDYRLLQYKYIRKNTNYFWNGESLKIRLREYVGAGRKKIQYTTPSF